MKKILIMLLSIFCFSCSYETKQEQETTASSTKKEVGAKDHGRNTIETGTPPEAMAIPSTKTSRIGQNNSLGIWLWYIQGTGYSSHAALATKLQSLGIKRIYVKVADGSYDPVAWPEVDDKALTDAYKAKGIEVFAWAYNYPGNDAAQAKVLYQAAKAGYEGFVTDIEIEFDRTTTALTSILSQFVSQKNKAITDGYATASFKFYCTSWGNPKDHGMRVDLIDQYVDGHMPQTYVEVWGPTYQNNAAQWVQSGTDEYRSLGCVKPIHHIVSDENDLMTSGQINSFIAASGAETSLWRVPGGGTSLNIWNTLQNVNWEMPLYNTKETITLTTPGTIQVGTPATLTGSTSAGVTKVKVYADTYLLGEATPTNGAWSYTYTFNTAGNNRNIIAKGFNSSGVEVATTNKLVNVLPAGTIVTAVVPTAIYTGKTTYFTGTASTGVTKVELSTDGYFMNEVPVTNGNWSTIYTYNTAGNNRVLTLKGKNSAGTVIATATYTFNVIASAAYLTDVPYFYQYSNSINPGGSCQNTTIAMVLKYYAIKAGKTNANSITPDYISNYWGTSQAQTVSGYQSVFNSEAATLGLAVRDAGSTTMALANFRAAAASGKPVVVHGYFTSYGHVMTVIGYDGTYYYCNDPAGKWNQTYAGGGYSTTNATEGKGIKYAKAAFESAISPDGTVWAHIFN
jgi:uncharacterized protein YvpB